MSYRLARLEKPVAIPFDALHPVFGHATKELKHFKQKFPAVVAQAVRFYKGAKVSATETGLILHPSPPAVPGKLGEGIGPRAVSKAAVPHVSLTGGHVVIAALPGLLARAEDAEP